MLDNQSDERHICRRQYCGGNCLHVYRMRRMSLAFPPMENGDLREYVGKNPPNDPTSLVCLNASDLNDHLKEWTRLWRLRAVYSTSINWTSFMGI